MVTLGLTTILAEVSPVLHKSVPVPTAVSVVEAPAHIVDGEAETLILGSGFTNTVTDVVPEQPAAFVPVTEYVVVAFGLTEIVAPVCPVLHA